MLQNRKTSSMAPAEPNTKHRELQGRNIGCLITNGATQEKEELMLKG